jgi:hypothetical protein
MSGSVIEIFPIHFMEQLIVPEVTGWKFPKRGLFELHQHEHAEGLKSRTEES